MSRTALSLSLALAAVWLIVGKAQAGDFESRLLQRYQGNNQSAAEKLKEQVAEDLARAASTGNPEPKKFLDRLQADLRRLQDDSYLARNERDSLIEQLKERVAFLKKEVARLSPKVADISLEMAKAPPEDDKEPLARERTRRLAPFFNSSASFQVTPVVLPGRRWVRIGIGGGFAGFHSAVVNTTVNVPDGGTVVVGGLGLVSEGRNEFGAPGLGQLPYLGRLFRNVGYGRQVSRTNLSVSVRIISMHEEEELFLRSGR